MASRVGFDVLPTELARDLRSCITEALALHLAFPREGDPLEIFRSAIAEAVRDIEEHPRGRLLQRFLRDGPFEGGDAIPADLAGRRLTDDKAASAIAFIYGHMVACFQGRLAELLALRPVLRLVRGLGDGNAAFSDARVFVGDAVLVPTNERRAAKGADFHVLKLERTAGRVTAVKVVGVAEVKSYACSRKRLRAQLVRHSHRAALGLVVDGEPVPRERVVVVSGAELPALIGVVPAHWKLSRKFTLVPFDGGRQLQVEPTPPPLSDDEIERTGACDWHVTLRWSREAIAQAAYEVTFWYMAEVGEVIYRNGVPKNWSEMTPAQAGQNAVKMMLYYAIARCRTSREHERAVALYNTYSFGYALGMNFRDSDGARQMLWPEDLDEILSKGATSSGCRIAP